MLLTFLVSILLIRYLGPKQYGTWAYALSFVSLFTSMSVLGLESIVVRDLVRGEKGSQNTILGSAFLMMLVGSVLMFVVVCSIAALSQGFDNTFWLIALVAGSNVILIFNVIAFHFQAVVKSYYTSAALFVQSVVDAVGKLLLVIGHLPLLYLGGLMILETLVMAGILIYCYQTRYGSLVLWRSQGRVVKHLFWAAWPLALSGAAVSLYMQADVVMLHYLKGRWAVGQYSVGLKLVQVWYLLPTIVLQNILPYFVTLKKDHAMLRFEQHMVTLFRYGIWLSVIMAILISVFSHEIALLLFGKQYMGSGEVLLIASWSLVFVCLGVFSQVWIISENKQNYSFYRTVAGLVVVIVMNFLLIPSLGAVGAALSMVVGYSVAGLFFDLVLPSTRLLFLYKLKALLPL